MRSLAEIRRPSSPETVPHNGEPHPTKVMPFGLYGGGLLTGHPVGLVIVSGILFMGLVGIPEARPFFAASAALGAVCGLVLWLRHR
jgi:hypothetical protein